MPKADDRRALRAASFDHLMGTGKKRGGQPRRWRIIGLADSRVLFVVFVERDGDVIRIISLRKATKREVRDYFDQKAP